MRWRLSAARELSLMPGHRIVVLWPGDGEFAAAVESCGATFVARPAGEPRDLETAGVAGAVSILAVVA